MNERILEAAASILNGPDNYTRKLAAALPNHEATYVGDPRASAFSITGLIERAAHLTDDRVGATAAKSLLCLQLGTVHLDYWESRTKPTWEQVRDVLLNTRCQT